MIPTQKLDENVKFIDDPIKEVEKRPEKIDKFYKDEENKRIIEQTKKNIQGWVNKWDNNRPEILLEIKEYARQQDIYTKTELVEWLKEDYKKYKKEVHEKDIKEKVQESEQSLDDKTSSSNTFSDKIIKLLLKKKKSEATELIVQELLKIFRFYTTKDDIKTEIWVFNKGIYIPQGKSFIKEKVRMMLRQHYNLNIINTVIAKIEADTFIEHNQFFNKNDNIKEIPILDGIFNLETYEITPFTPEKIFFNKIPVHYDPDAKCPNIEKHFNEILKSPDDIKVMYELFGFLLWKDYFLEKAFMMIGCGRNGKGKTIELMKRFLGVDNCSGVSLTSLTENNFRVSELFGKMLNIAGDLSNTSLKNTGVFKGLTARDMMGSPRKFMTDINFTNYAKLVFACNELPRVYDYSDGFWERWVLFEFPFKFIPEKQFCNRLDKTCNEKMMDTELISKLSTQEELDGLFIKALEGLKVIRKNKDFSYSKGTDEIKKFWMRKADSFMAFCLDHLESDYDNRMSKGDLRMLYHQYCQEHKVRGVSDQNIKAVLQEMFGVDEIDTTVDYIKIRFWVGITLKKTSKYNYVTGKLLN